MKRIKKFSVYQTARVVGMITLLLTAIIIIPIGLLISLTGSGSAMGFPYEGGLIIVLVPLLYAVISFIVTALSCLIYNMVSGWVGGIELEFEIMETEEINDHLVEYP